MNGKKAITKMVQCVNERERDRLMCITLASENNGYYIRFIKIQRMKYARFILFPFRARYKQNGASLKHCKISVNRVQCAVISFSHTKLCAAKILSSSPLIRSIDRPTDLTQPTGSARFFFCLLLLRFVQMFQHVGHMDTACVTFIPT